MKKIILSISTLILMSVALFYACEKTSILEDSVQTSPEPLSKKGGRTNTGSATGSTSYQDSLYQACGMWLSDTGSTYPSVYVNNIRWWHHTSYSSPTTPYDVIVITFDVPVIAGKTISSYMLVADHCSGRPVCNKENGIYVSQVTTGVPYNQFWMPIGTTWLAPNVTYTGMITVITTEGCMYLSQPFTFEGPYIL